MYFLKFNLSFSKRIYFLLYEFVISICAYLSEFTCDVSVEGGISTQPLQFSFTFYDLDGHHGKITKDDIVGIVYTIYESIGKSVIVPHCGSKTINVRLTVSPESKLKTAGTTGGNAGTGTAVNSKLKKANTPSTTTTSALKTHSSNNTNSDVAGLSMAVIGGKAACVALNAAAAGRRQHHRYRPRKLIKSDDEDNDVDNENASNSEQKQEAAGLVETALANEVATAPTTSKSIKSNHNNKYKAKLERDYQKQQNVSLNCCQQRQNVTNLEQNIKNQGLLDTNNTQQQPQQNMYENITNSLNLKCCQQRHQNQQQQSSNSKMKTPCIGGKSEECHLNDNGGGDNAAGVLPVTLKTTPTAATNSSTNNKNNALLTNDVYMKQASTRVKMLRKARKQKYQDHCYETRQRSLSVGHEYNGKITNRHIILNSPAAINNSSKNYNNNSIVQQKQTNGKNIPGLLDLNHQHQQQQPNSVNVDMVDGVQLRNVHKNVALTSSLAASNSTTTTTTTSTTTTGAAKQNSSDCWKNALNRNDLISIIRESMEKNRLCFQLNGKPQANVSPIRKPTPTQSPGAKSVPSHQSVQPLSTTPKMQQQLVHHQHQHHHHHQQRQRSAAVSKIPTLIANHTNNLLQLQTSLDHQSTSKLLTITASCNSNNNYINNNNYNQNSNGSVAIIAANTNMTNNNAAYAKNNNQQLVLGQQIHLENVYRNNQHTSNSSSYYHPQPHIPIYHQQMALSPAVLAVTQKSALSGHNKTNLCGYDSYLHATFCDGVTKNTPKKQLTITNHNNNNYNNNTNNNNNNNNNTTIQHAQQQPIAAVQPLLTSSTPLPSPKSAPIRGLTPTTNSTNKSATKTVPTIKTKKTLQKTKIKQHRYKQQQHQHQQDQHYYYHHHQNVPQQNSPQYHGYQRLSSTKMQHHEQQQQLEKWLQDETNNKEIDGKTAIENATQKSIQNFDNLLYARLQNKLHIGKENMSYTQQQKCSTHNHNNMNNNITIYKRKQQQQNTENVTNKMPHVIGRMKNEYINMILLHGDPLECEHLLSQTTDDELLITPTASNALINLDAIQLEEKSSDATTTSTTTTTTTTTTTMQVISSPRKLTENGQYDDTTALIDLYQDQNVVKSIETVNDELHLLALSNKTAKSVIVDDDDDDDDDDNDNNADADVEEEVEVENELMNDNNIDEELPAVTLAAKDMANVACTQIKNKFFMLNERNGVNDVVSTKNDNCIKPNTSISSSNSSLVHRYVHEHIHHHYHHFEDKGEGQVKNQYT